MKSGWTPKLNTGGLGCVVGVAVVVFALVLVGVGVLLERWVFG